MHGWIPGYRNARREPGPWASFSGGLLQLVATRIEVDPPVVCAPLITTFVDETRPIICLLIARAALGN